MKDRKVGGKGKKGKTKKPKPGVQEKKKYESWKKREGKEEN